MDAKVECVRNWRDKVFDDKAQRQLNQALGMNQASQAELAQLKDDLLADTTVFELTETRAQLEEEKRKVDELVSDLLVKDTGLKAGAIKLLRDILGKLKGRTLIKDMLRRWHAKAIADPHPVPNPNPNPHWPRR